MHIINSLGDICPLPVVKAKQFIKEHPTLEFSIKVDNIEAVSNLQNLAAQLNFSTEVKSFASSKEQPRSALSQATSYTVTFIPTKEEYIVNKTLTIETDDLEETPASTKNYSGHSVKTPSLALADELLVPVSPSADNYVVLINSEEMGRGDKNLGQQLLHSFFYALSESEKLPVAVIFYNSGIFVSTTDDEKLLSDLTILAEAGTEILTCGLCLNYYQKTKDLKIGTITNMYTIVEYMSKYRVVTP